MKIKFETTDWETRIIDRIIERACVAKNERMSLEMDLRACHCNGAPLELDKLLSAEALDFWHDIRGIQKHINRVTGKLGDFEPRCALKQRKAA